MARKPTPPTYRRQRSKSGDRAFVQINGTRHYLGRYNTSDSRERYNRLIAEWAASGGAMPPDAESITIVELIDRYWEHVQGYYHKVDGSPTWEQANIQQALRPVAAIYGKSLVKDFGPRSIKAVRQCMIEAGNCRNHINKQIDRVKRMMRWAVAEELAPANVYTRLQAVAGLRRGRSDAKESEPVRPVPGEHIEVVRVRVSRQIRAIIDVQLHTGARPGEVLSMRAIDIDTSMNVWRFTPQSHKTAHHGHTRVIHIGPKAQEALRPFLADRPVDRPLFSPREAVAESRAERRRNRKTPESCGNRPGTNRTTKPQRQPGDGYDVNSYRQAVQRACDQADIPRWSPNRLRHNCATQLRAEAGIDIAQTILGHRLGSAITEIYAATNVARAVDVIARVG